MAKKLESFVLLFVGTIFSAVSIGIMCMIEDAIKHPGVWAFAGFSFFFFFAGIAYAYGSLKQMKAERIALENGYHGYGVISNIRISATVTINGFQKKYYSITIRFRNDIGEDLEYTVSDTYDEYKTAYLLTKKEVAIIYSGEFCAIEEVMEENVYDLDLLDAQEIISHYKKTKQTGINLEEIDDYNNEE